MIIFICIFGLLMMILGIMEILHPQAMNNLLHYFVHNGQLNLIGIHLLVFGIIFIHQSPQTRYPILIYLLGTILIILAFILILLPRKIIIKLYNFFFKKSFSKAKTLMLFDGFIRLFIGGLIFYSATTFL